MALIGFDIETESPEEFSASNYQSNNADGADKEKVPGLAMNIWE
jgi:hypothetical protein